MSWRILHVLDHSLPQHSGYAFRTAAILREQQALGWQTVQLTTPKHGPGVATQQQVDEWLFHRTPNQGNENLLTQMQLTARRLTTLVATLHPQLIHAHSPVLNALPSLWVGRQLRVPVVYEMRASWEDAAVDHGTTKTGSVRYRTSRALETFALRHAAAVTTICEGLRRDIIARGIAEERITVIPNAVDIEQFHFGAQPDPTLRQALKLEGMTVLGFAGSFYSYEGLQLLIAAAQRLLPRYPRLRILLVGGGPQEAALRAQVVACGLEGQVILTGRVPHAEVQRYYNLIDVLVYPRLPMRLTELVTPLKPLEAMAQGRVVLASDVGGHRELIRDQVTGFLFPAGDVTALMVAIEVVLAQQARWPAIRTQARHFVETERTWQHSVARYTIVYAHAINTAASTPIYS